MTTLCGRCGEKLNDEGGEVFIICEKCHRYTPRGSVSFERGEEKK